MRRELQPAARGARGSPSDQQAIVGQVWLHTVRKIPNPIAEREQLAYLSNLYVQAVRARRHRHAPARSRARLVPAPTAIDRVVLWPSARSVTLYLRHGFSRGGDVMELKITKLTIARCTSA